MIYAYSFIPEQSPCQYIPWVLGAVRALRLSTSPDAWLLEWELLDFQYDAGKFSGRASSGLTRIRNTLQRCGIPWPGYRLRKYFVSQLGRDKSPWIFWLDQPVKRDPLPRSASRPSVVPRIPTQTLDETNPIIMTSREEPRS